MRKKTLADCLKRLKVQNDFMLSPDVQDRMLRMERRQHGKLRSTESDSPALRAQAGQQVVQEYLSAVQGDLAQLRQAMNGTTAVPAPESQTPKKRRGKKPEVFDRPTAIKELADLESWLDTAEVTDPAYDTKSIKAQLLAGKLKSDIAPEPAKPAGAATGESTLFDNASLAPATYGMFGFPTNEKFRPDKIGVPEPVKADNPEVERQLAASHGVQKETLLNRIKDMASLTWRAVTRAQLHIPNDAEHATMNEMFRLANEHSPMAQDQANRNIAQIVDPLGPQQLQLFTRKAVIDNLLASVDRGEPLRFGFNNRDEVDAYKSKLDTLADATPEVKAALAKRQQVVHEMVDKLISLDLLPAESKAEADNYYHQQVLQYASISKLGSNPQINKKGFQKQRVKGVESFDESLNYNTSFLEAEFEWMRDAYHQIAKEEWLRDLGKRFDIKDELRDWAAKSKIPLEEAIGLKKATHRAWYAKPGNAFYQAVGVAEHVVEDVLAGIEDVVEVGRDDLRNLLAMGGKQREMILPNVLVDQLEAMQAPATGGDPFGQAISNISAEAQRMWKTWTLFNPLRAFAYNLRNMTGDADPVIGGAAASLVYTNRAVRELSTYHGVFGQEQVGNLSADMKTARDLGVVGSALAVNEIPSIRDLAIFRRFYSSKKQGAADAVSKYFETVKRYSAFRESIMRYASFLYYKDALAKGTLSHYGGAKKATVDALAKEMGPEFAAAHLSRNLMGDYGDLTVMGNFLRKHLVPFWSWQEINLKRYPQMFVNAAAFGNRAAKDNPAKAAAYSSAAIGSLMLPYIVMQLFNRLMWPDDENKLSDDERASPHLILGKNADGSLMILRNTGALGDFAEWFGLNTMLARLDEMMAKQMTVLEVAKEAGQDLVNKAIQGVRPDLKAVAEIPAGRSLYPNVFNPRSVRRDDQLAGYIGLTDAYRALRGRVLREGSRGRPHTAERTIGVTDPRKNALFEIVELRDRYLKKLGEEPPQRGNQYFANMREAASANDPQAFAEARSAYLAHGGDYSKFKSAINALDPLSSKMKDADEKEFEQNYLTPDQRQKLVLARDYARNLEVGMWALWHESAKGDSPEVASKLKDQQRSEAVTLAKHVIQAKPHSLTPKEKAAGKTLKAKHDEWQAQKDSAKAKLAQSPLGQESVVEAFSSDVRANLKDHAAEAAKIRAFRREMGWLKRLGSN